MPGFLACWETTSPGFSDSPPPGFHPTSEHIGIWAWGLARIRQRAGASLFRKRGGGILRCDPLSMSAERRCCEFWLYPFLPLSNILVLRIHHASDMGCIKGILDYSLGGHNKSRGFENRIQAHEPRRGPQWAQQSLDLSPGFMAPHLSCPSGLRFSAFLPWTVQQSPCLLNFSLDFFF